MRHTEDSSHGTTAPHLTQDDLVDTLHKELSKQSFGIPIRAAGDSIDVLKEPKEFYDSLCSGVANSKRRIVLSSLYIGTGHHEKRLVELMDQQLSQNKDLVVDLLFDALRGTRGGITGPTAKSSCSLLLPLLEKYGASRVRIHLYHTPNLNGIWKRLLPERMNEVVGVQHIKAYIFDDDMLISGANLSDWYFVDRQDRYMMIRNQPLVADYFSDLVKCVDSFSYQLTKEGALVLPGIAKHGAGTAFDPVSQSHAFKQDAGQRLQEFINTASDKYSVLGEALSEKEGVDTWVYPSVQAGPMNIRQDETITKEMLRAANIVSKNSGDRLAKLYLASAYFNMTSEYVESLVDGLKGGLSARQNGDDALCDIITACPSANGFFTAKDMFSRQIPWMYSVMEKRFFEQIAHESSLHLPATTQGQKPHEAIRLFEYARLGWTFHAKGLWVYDKKTNLPVATMIGSPNFGRRSVERDIEAQIVLLTRDKKLQKKLDDERRYLFESTVPVTQEVLQAAERQASSAFQLLTRAMAKFL